MARCAFCGKDATLNRQHVIGRKFQNDMPGPAKGQLPHLVHLDSVRGSRRVAAEFDIKVRCQCPECNGGWMDRIDEDVRPILRPMIWGEPRTLSPDDQHLIARWATEVCLVADFTHRSAERLVRPSTFHEFYERHEPPDHTRISLAAYAHRHPLLDLLASPVRIGPEEDRSHGHLVTIRLCQVVVKIVIPWVRLPLSGSLGDKRFDIVIWPPRCEPVSWPPERILRDPGELLAYANTVPPP